MRLQRIERCPYSKQACAVYFDEDVFQQLTEAVSEWQYEFVVFLKGEKDHERIAVVRDVYVPKQTVTAASATAQEYFDPRKYVGIAHSHHQMGAFHSHVDESGADNAPLSIVMSTRGWCAKFAFRLPCGRWGVSTNVTFVRGKSHQGNVDEEKQRIVSATVTELGDCPEAGSSKTSCGISVRRNRIMEAIRQRAKITITIPTWRIKYDRDRVRNTIHATPESTE